MTHGISFKERVANVVSYYSHDYKSVFVDYEYLVCSDAFSRNPYYIVTAEEDNYLHLSGVSYPNPQLFFTRCITGSLSESDISFCKKGQSENAVKGSVRRKIRVLPNLVKLFDSPIVAEESFSKNRVVCSFGASDYSCTVGFTLSSPKDLRVRPMTLLSGCELDPSKTKNVDLVLRRTKGAELFDVIVVGDKDIIAKYGGTISHLLSESLKPVAVPVG